jgi:L-fuculose-phosphate aldolase
MSAERTPPLVDDWDAGLEMDVDQARIDLVVCGRVLQQRGLLTQTAGNLSIRVGRDRVLITPTSLAYDICEAADMVLTDLDGVVVEGRRAPSSEVPLHTLVYRTRPDVSAIVHTHSPYATTMAILGKPIPAVHYMVAALNVTEVKVAEYATYGTEELAENVRQAFPAPSKAVLIGNHGMVAAARSLNEAADAAETLEILAGLYHRALAIGRPNVLSDEQMALVQAKYRQKAEGP